MRPGTPPAEGGDSEPAKPHRGYDAVATGPARAVGWMSTSFAGRQLVQLLTVVFLARFLGPSDFGVVALALVVTGLLTAVRDVGLGAAIVRHQAPTQPYLSTVFWVANIVGASMGLIVFLAAPGIAIVLEEPSIVDLLRVLAIGFSAGALGTVHQAMLERSMQFSLLARVELGAVLIGSVVAFTSAWAGAGAMSLALQAVATSSAGAVGLWLALGWRPSRSFALGELRRLLAFGLPLAATNALNYVVRSADYLVIGVVLGPEQLGYYILAYRLAFAPLQVVSAALSRVLLPMYSRDRSDLHRLRTTYLSSTGYVAFFGLPMALGTSVMAGLLIQVGFGELWRPAGAVLGVLGIVVAGQLVGTTVGPLYLAMGRSGLFLAYGIVSSVLFVLSFLIGVQFGILGVAIAYTVTSLALLVPFVIVPLRLVGLSLADLGAAVARSTLCALIMAAVIGVTVHGLPGGPLVLLLALAEGVAVYVASSLVLNRSLLLKGLREFRRGIANAW